MILGLDISTNCSGWVVMDSDKKIIDYGYINTSKCDTWIDKAKKFELEVVDILLKHEITKIGIEDIVSKFASGRSKASIIITLARFNGIASYIINQYSNIIPEHINVLRARNLAECKIPKSVNTKEFVLSKVMDWYPEIIWPKMKTKDKLAKQCYDIADSIIVARAILNSK